MTTLFLQNEATRTSARKRTMRNTFTVNFLAGGVAGTVGTFATSPLDVVQTRLQSSVVNPKLATSILNKVQYPAVIVDQRVIKGISIDTRPWPGMKVISYMLHIKNTEGITALYKGLIPNLVGIAPSRAIYFTIYSKMKHVISNNTSLAHSSWTHMLSALSASWSVSTITNPIWFLKTRLQLDLTEGGKKRTVVEISKEVFRHEGISGFYRGLSASYIGASETVVYFVLYEQLKQYLSQKGEHNLGPIDYAGGAFLAKTIATISSYPHEVARTRLRQASEGNNGKKLYCGFIQTILKVWREEGLIGLYGGMGAHLMRQVPNTVIMFLTYESIVNFFSGD